MSGAVGSHIVNTWGRGCPRKKPTLRKAGLRKGEDRGRDRKRDTGRGTESRERDRIDPATQPGYIPDILIVQANKFHVVFQVV